MLLIGFRAQRYVATRRGLSTVREIQAAPPSRVFHDQTSGQAQGTSSLGSRGAYGQVGGRVLCMVCGAGARP